MYRKVSFFLSLIILIVNASCYQASVIPVSNNLEIALGNNYSEYVKLLNKAANKDTLALSNFLEISNLNNAAGYDHGWILIKLMEKLGDACFANSLKNKNSTQIRAIRQYFEVGIDGASDKNKAFLKFYPMSFTLLGLDINRLEK